MHDLLLTDDSTTQHIFLNFRLLVDFIAWRGHFTKFLCTPYERREGWAMAVTLFNGTWYISEVETEENRARRKNMNSRELEMTYWGYKFEQYVTSGKLKLHASVGGIMTFCGQGK